MFYGNVCNLQNQRAVKVVGSPENVESCPDDLWTWKKLSTRMLKTFSQRQPSMSIFWALNGQMITYPNSAGFLTYNIMDATEKSFLCLSLCVLSM